jgi:hypothetical protein
MLEETLLEYTYLSSVIEWGGEIVLEIAITPLRGSEQLSPSYINQQSKSS